MSSTSFSLGPGLWSRLLILQMSHSEMSLCLSVSVCSWFFSNWKDSRDSVWSTWFFGERNALRRKEALFPFLDFSLWSWRRELKLGFSISTSHGPIKSHKFLFDRAKESGVRSRRAAERHIINWIHMTHEITFQTRAQMDGAAIMIPSECHAQSCLIFNS